MIRRLWSRITFLMSAPKNNLIAIVGTTGVGKSQFSIDLAKAINGEIINADSMQMYKGLDQITNKHPVEERGDIPHHVMNHVDWNEEYFIHRFAAEANHAIEDIHNRGKTPIIVGGTHYYLLSILFNNKTISESKPEAGRELTADQLSVLDGPVDEIFAQLHNLDPVIAGKFHPYDKRKLRRALEIYYTTQLKTLDIYKKQKQDELQQSSLRFNTLFFWVYSDLEVLRPRLDDRVDKMMDQGALDEVNTLYGYYKSQSPPPDITTGIWQVIGFKEFLTWLETQSSADFSEAVTRMKIRTRQYAKSQVKWIRKLLATELNKESRFDFKHGGKIYLLDATDLSMWDQNVLQMGLDITQQFLTNGPTSVSYPQTPDKLYDVFPNSEYLASINSNKSLGSESRWKHLTCSVCKDKNGNPFVAIGEDNYKLHVEGRRHKRQVGAHERKRKHQGIMLAKKKTANNKDIMENTEHHG